MLQTSEKPRNIYVSYHSQSQKAVHKNMDGYSLYKEVRQAKPFYSWQELFFVFPGCAVAAAHAWGAVEACFMAIYKNLQELYKKFEFWNSSL
jgi:hypothetical protein